MKPLPPSYANQKPTFKIAAKMSPLFLTLIIAVAAAEACFGGRGGEQLVVDSLQAVEEALKSTPAPRPQNENEYQLALREHQKKMKEFMYSAPYSSKFFEGIVYMASPSLHPKAPEAAPSTTEEP